MRNVLIILVLLFITGYLLYNIYGTSLRKALDDPLPIPDPISDPCIFLENDIVSENVHDNYGNIVRKNNKIACSQCGDYTYKGPDGCSNYQKDFLYTVFDRQTNKNIGVCSSLSFPRECEFKSKNPPQTE